MLEEILSITGEQSLFKIITQGKNNIIVESLMTGKRKPAFSTSKISKLEDVAIFTEDGDMPLKDIIIKIFEKHGKEIPVTVKSSESEFRDFLQDVLPNYDKDKVYYSDIKKLVNWYNQLVEYNIINEENIKKDKDKEAETKENTDKSAKPETKKTGKIENKKSDNIINKSEKIKTAVPGNTKKGTRKKV